MSEENDEESRTPVEGDVDTDLAGGAQQIVSALETLKSNAYLPRNGAAVGPYQDADFYDEHDFDVPIDEADGRGGFETGRRETEADLLASMCSFNDPHFADLDTPQNVSAPAFDKRTHSTMTVRSRNKTKTLQMENGAPLVSNNNDAGTTATSLRREAVPVSTSGNSQSSDYDSSKSKQTIEELVRVIDAYDRLLQRLTRTHREVRENEQRALRMQRDAALKDVAALQRSTGDLQGRLEGARTLLERARTIETAWQSKVPALVSKYSSLKRTAEEQLEKAYREVEASKAKNEVEVMDLRSRLRRVELERDSLREECARRANESAELHAICDELVAKLNEAAS